MSLAVALYYAFISVFLRAEMKYLGTHVLEQEEVFLRKVQILSLNLSLYCGKLGQFAHHVRVLVFFDKAAKLLSLLRHSHCERQNGLLRRVYPDALPEADDRVEHYPG